MNSRDINLKNIRPILACSLSVNNISSDEAFQNVVLRPIIKLQNDLFISVFKNYIKKRKSVFYNLTTEKRIAYIENAIQKDTKFRNSLKGMVIGMFTVEEYKKYTENSSALNKRMMHIVKERLLSNMQLFEKPDAVISI